MVPPEEGIPSTVSQSASCRSNPAKNEVVTVLWHWGLLPTVACSAPRSWAPLDLDLVSFVVGPILIITHISYWNLPPCSFPVRFLSPLGVPQNSHAPECGRSSNIWPSLLYLLFEVFSFQAYVVPVFWLRFAILLTLWSPTTLPVPF